MAFTCAGVRCSTPRSCFVKPSVEAVPRQVIGFDLSPKGERTEALPNLNGDDDDIMIKNPRFKCSNPCLISSEAANLKTTTANTATSPRSALQQLLLRPVDPQSEPAASSSPAVNQNKVSNGPLLIEPACKPLVAKQSLRVGLPKSTKPYVERDIPVSAATHGNCQIFKGIAELVGPSHCARPINDGRYGISSAAAVSAIKCVAGNDERSRWLGATIHELPRRSERNGNVESSWNIEDQRHELPPCTEKSKKSSWIKELMTNIECPHCQHEKSSNVEISWKQANKTIPDQSKKGSLFMLGASSPAAEYTKQFPLQGVGHYRADHNMDMDFLNSCYLCKRVLSEGHDAFMYNGDKAFCSMECRYQQIVIDERKERHAPPIIRSGASPVYQSHMTTAGAAAVATASAIATTHRPITINRPNFMNPAAAA